MKKLFAIVIFTIMMLPLAMAADLDANTKAVAKTSVSVDSSGGMLSGKSVITGIEMRSGKSVITGIEMRSAIRQKLFLPSNFRVLFNPKEYTITVSKWKGPSLNA